LLSVRGSSGIAVSTTAPQATACFVMRHVLWPADHAEGDAARTPALTQ
jgi:hypothetical protein